LAQPPLIDANVVTMVLHGRQTTQTSIVLFVVPQLPNTRLHSAATLLLVKELVPQR
jgi:hypothetical protein